jgi:glucosamine-6-phosphate deaminase
VNAPALTVVADAPAVHEAFARWLADFIAERNAAGQPTRLILPVGPTLGYPLLTAICNRERISWADVKVITMDEYLDWTGRPVSPGHPLSFTGFMQRFLASLDDELRPPSNAYVWPDPFEINRVEGFIKHIGGIDACLGGIGIHGHVAFNEPPISRFAQIGLEEFADSPTRVVPLAPETIVMNASRAQGGRFQDFPTMAVTVGMREILGSQRIRLFCEGGVWQQEAILQAVSGHEDLAYPVSLLARHPDAAIVADELSAAKATARHLMTSNPR